MSEHIADIEDVHGGTLTVRAEYTAKGRVCLLTERSEVWLDPDAAHELTLALMRASSRRVDALITISRLQRQGEESGA